MSDEEGGVEVEEEAPAVVQSSFAPPLVNCPSCKGMLPLGLGEKKCSLCGAVSRVEHEPTRKEWREEKVACPACSKVLVCGVDERPAKIACGSCSTIVNIEAKVLKVEITCPACERRLRLRPRPGARQVTCPACDDEFKVTF